MIFTVYKHVENMKNMKNIPRLFTAYKRVENMKQIFPGTFQTINNKIWNISAITINNQDYEGFFRRFFSANVPS
jgi:ferritin